MPLLSNLSVSPYRHINKYYIAVSLAPDGATAKLGQIPPTIMIVGEILYTKYAHISMESRVISASASLFSRIFSSAS